LNALLPRFDQPIEPMILGNLRELGVHSAEEISQRASACRGLVAI
jgi:hypothetical protein